MKKINKYNTEWRNDAGQLHREDGPAREWSDGSKEWYLNGNRYSIEEYMELISDDNRDKILFNLDIYR